jgi:PAS domain S-box-containing protein
MPIGISDAAGRIEYLNPRFQQTFGYAPDELATVEHWLQRAYPDPDYRQAMEKRWEQAIAQAVQDQRPSDALDVHVTCRDGSVRIMQVFGAVVGGRLIAVFNDLTERVRSEEALRASLAEKETLLKEVHHRVKNNLQVISSLLSLQFRQIKSPDLRVFLHDTQNRIRSMAMVHEILYRSGDISALSFTGYVKNLCEHLSRSYGSPGRRIRLINHIADVRLDLDHAIVAGLIVNELVTNALKHAFGSRPEGEIRVELQPAGEGRLALRVSDNGDGLPADAPLEGPGTLGLLLVKNLARQLDGELAVRSDYGSLFEVSFPLNLPEGKMVPQTP